ncbi:MAG: hypothetical protein AAFR11_12950, partial [Pseudomonadota bacterium]
MSEAGRYHALAAAVTRARRALSAAAPRIAEARGALARWSEAESGRLFLWCAPAFGFGALAYLAPATEPPVWIGAV